jgi:large subunit ribosomal protein L30
MLRIKLVKSTIGNTKRNRATVAALGLRKMNQSVLQPDNGAIRGMIHRVAHMVTVEVVEGEAAAKKAAPKKAAAVKADPAAEAKPKRAAAPKAEKAEGEAKPKRTTKKTEGTKE